VASDAPPQPGRGRCFPSAPAAAATKILRCVAHTPTPRLPPLTAGCGPAILRPSQGRTLLQLARAFYTDPSAHRLVYRFNHEPEKFDFDQLLAELGHRGVQAAAGGTGSESRPEAKK
jgi:hypothetical protein